ncbi:hypothetical protein MLD38_011199 [Melastoma candidum]|uniref:Uncharacterized protein n=1 Tax=Melastoma candidum TaxID=119954 RepID=A0ACB9R2C2_9MYRT|nr:hypothetical protein MLD38_011199 [Melastoma candidum]
MGWFPCSHCSGKSTVREESRGQGHQIPSSSDKLKVKPALYVQEEESKDSISSDLIEGAHTFTFRELSAATRNFRSEYLFGEDGFGRVYKDVWRARIRLLPLSSSIGMVCRETRNSWLKC